ncbi:MULTISPECIES: carboxypeptidase-like regulatory domain-containing protein [Flavobacteriaceae]|uniref:carboxypeptidase-like regulatory domain-containing protein n=1 Tax=Flavobacteriaceae TaxID=49546 RepID=UPI0023497FB9|nr:carboxypeptidase-like regulatory domain-containing protein [Muricauda sp. SP22]MDC6362869.1 carboxypeptidase-like regulatory domain-containing protein [Muricauda sp. SP22]
MGYKMYMLIIAYFFSNLTFCQIYGTVRDGANGNAIPYVNVWLKNKLIGATTGSDGKFTIEKAKIGDTLHISCLGYSTMEMPANKENIIVLKPEIHELDEVVVIPMDNTKESSIISFEKIKKNRNWYNNGHYSLARFYDYIEDCQKTPFLGQISLITLNAKKEDVVFRIRLVEVGPNGEPSQKGLTENLILKSKNGINEITVDLKKEKILFPKNGFFVIVDRLNLNENKSFNRTSKIEILQPAIGMERKEQEKNTWFGYGGRWIPPLEMKNFLGSNGNIAVNIKLTN